MKRYLALFLAFSFFAILTTSVFLQRANASVTTKTYTADADFDQGTLMGLEHTTVHDQLQLSKNITTFPTMWIANAGEDTISKWDTNTNKELARYRTWFGPAGYQGYYDHIGDAYAGAAPSRTCVDLQGNVYVANRHFDGNASDVIKIFANDWIDRNHDGIMETSTNSTALPMNDTNNNGRIDWNETQDERIAWVVSVGPAGALGRSLSISPNGDIWLGLYYAQTYYKLNSTDGNILGGPINVSPNTPYGSLIDRHGILWGASEDNTLLRLDTNTYNVTVYYHSGFGVDYGIALGIDEHNNTIVYQADQLGGKTYIQFNSSSETFSNPASLQYCCLGIATDSEGNIFASHRFTGEVSKFWPNGTLIWTAAAQVASEARGTVVDSNDDVWVIHRVANKLSKFYGTNGTAMCVRDTGDSPYTYSDATGLGLRSVIAGIGFWTVTFDSEVSNAPWGTISWHSFEPNGTSVKVEVRSSNDNANWFPLGWETVTNGTLLSTTPNGRYLQIETALQIMSGEVSPILYDLTVQSSGPLQLLVSISPLLASISVGDSVTFTSTVSGGVPQYSYQWYLDTNPVLGATSAGWTFTPTASGIYYVFLKVTDSQGNTNQSETARITAYAVPVGGYSVDLSTHSVTNPYSPYYVLAMVVAMGLVISRGRTRRQHQSDGPPSKST